ncbi:unnamed protein product, partial [marine sediment metagenome]
GNPNSIEDKIVEYARRNLDGFHIADQDQFLAKIHTLYQQNRGILSSKAPHVLTAAVLYVLLNHEGIRVTQAQMASKFNCSITSIRDSQKIFQKSLKYHVYDGERIIKSNVP